MRIFASSLQAPVWDGRRHGRLQAQTQRGVGMRRRQFSCPFHPAKTNASARASRRGTRRPARHAAGANVFYQAVWSYPDTAASAGSPAGKTPQGRKKQQDETGSIQGGDVEYGDAGSAVAITPGESLLCIKPLRCVRK